MKQKLQEAQEEYEQLSKSVKMLNSGTNSLNQILNTGKNSLNKHGLGYNSSDHKDKQKNLIVFVPVKIKRDFEKSSAELVENKFSYKKLKI